MVCLFLFLFFFSKGPKLCCGTRTVCWKIHFWADIKTLNTSTGAAALCAWEKNVIGKFGVFCGFYYETTQLIWDLRENLDQQRSSRWYSMLTLKHNISLLVIAQHKYHFYTYSDIIKIEHWFFFHILFSMVCRTVSFKFCLHHSDRLHVILNFSSYRDH